MATFPLEDFYNDFRLEDINSGPEAAHILGSRMGILFSLSINPGFMPENPNHDTPSQRMCRLVQRLRTPGITDDEYDAVSKSVFDRINFANFKRIHNQIISARKQSASPRLGDHLFPPIPFLHLVDDGEYGSLEFTDCANEYYPEEVKHAHPGADALAFEIHPDLYEFHVDELHVIESLVHSAEAGHVACKVVVDDEIMFCKAERGGIAFGDSVVGRDLRSMLEIRESLEYVQELGEEPPVLRVPGLRGVLCHPDEGHVIGFLRDWIPGASLESYDMMDIAVEQREEWDRKVARTVADLHELGVYWGAAENESVIIDIWGEPWVVDFGAKVNLGLKREDGDLEEGDWLDYDVVYKRLQPREEPFSDISSVCSSEPCCQEDTEMGDGDLSEC